MNNEEINTNEEINNEVAVEETTATETVEVPSNAIAQDDGTHEIPVEDAKPEDVTLNEDGSATVETASEEDGGPTAPESTGNAPVEEDENIDVNTNN